MTLIQAVVLGFIQGVTEFLPVSSSGHLVISQAILGLDNVPVSFDILLHGATLCAVVIFFRRYLLDRIIYPSIDAINAHSIEQVPKLVWLLGIGTIPAMIVGLGIRGYVEYLFSSISAVALGLLLTTTFLMLTQLFTRNKKTVIDLDWRDALVVGVFQAIAIWPGVSRSGSTVMAGLYRGMKRETAFNFSFMLSIPVIMGALVLDLGAIFSIPWNQLAVYLLGSLAAFVSGYYSLVVFKKIMVGDNLAWFGWYTLAVALLIVLL